MPARGRFSFKSLALKSGWWVALCICTYSSAHAQTTVPVMQKVSSLDGTQLDAWWFAAPKVAEPDTKRPAVIALHGCGGVFNVRGKLSERFYDYAQLLNAQGYHLLVLDSLTARGEKELCTQKIGKRRVTQIQRRADALGALQWAAAQPDVRAYRMALLGWSNGGSTVLAATNTTHREVRSFATPARAAVAFYPGCEAELARGYKASASLLLLVGREDDWTAAAPCEQLAKTSVDKNNSVAVQPTVQIQVFDGAYHGFDSTAPLRLRKDVPGGVKPGAGVHMGGHAPSREASQRALIEFLAQQLK
jgi:dienelactone hydrolase